MIIPHVIDQHAEDAAFLWHQRDAAVRAAHYQLTHLARWDDRVDAHLDGLRIAGEDGWQRVLAAASDRAARAVLETAGRTSTVDGSTVGDDTSP